jgi:hypothetical protein
MSVRRVRISKKRRRMSRKVLCVLGLASEARDAGMRVGCSCGKGWWEAGSVRDDRERDRRCTTGVGAVVGIDAGRGVVVGSGMRRTVRVIQ